MSQPCGVGVNSFFNAAVDEDPAVSVHVGPTLLFFINISNPNAVQSFVQCFDALLANVTVGTTTPTYSLAIEAGTGATVPGVLSLALTVPLSFRTGLVIAITSGATTNGAITADAVVNLGYLGA